MAKKADDSVMDAMLDKVATSTHLRVCAGEPISRADAITKELAGTALVAGNGNGDFTLANGDTNGRKTTVTQQANLSITASGDADHIALDDGVTLLEVTTCTLQSLTSGGTVTVPAWDVEVSDPS